MTDRHSLANKFCNGIGFTGSLLFTTIISLLLFCCNLSLGAPKLTLDKSPKVNFGRFITNREQTHTFSLKNEGDEPLKIIRIRNTCGCAVIDSKNKLIEPGSSESITIKIIPNSIKGKFSKKVFIETNDPKQRFTTLTLSGISMPRVVVTPKERIYAECLIIGQKTSFIYTLHKSDSTIDFKTPAVECNYPAEVKIHKTNESESLVTLSVTPLEKKDKLAATVTIPTDSNTKNDVKLHLSADVGAALYAVPPRIQIPATAKHFQTAVKILFAGLDLKEVEISKLEITPIDGVEVICGELKGNAITLQITFTEPPIKVLKSTQLQLNISYPNTQPTRCRLLIK